MQLRIRLAEMGGADGHVNMSHSLENNQEESSVSINPHNMIPLFNETRHDLDAYLNWFGRVTTGQSWPKVKWATALSLWLDGEALRVFGQLLPEDSLDYDKIKLALLKRFRLMADGYREKLRHSKPKD